MKIAVAYDVLSPSARSERVLDYAEHLASVSGGNALLLLAVCQTHEREECAARLAEVKRRRARGRAVDAVVLVCDVVDSERDSQLTAAGAGANGVAECLERFVAQFHPHILLVGTANKSMMERVVLGSVSQRLVDRAHCNVLVVKDKQMEMRRTATERDSEAATSPTQSKEKEKA